MESTHGINPGPLLFPSLYCSPYLGFRTQIGEEKQVSCPPAPTRRGWRHSPSPHSGRLDSLRSSPSKGMETAWLDRSFGKTTCCWRRFVAWRYMLPEEICCRRRYIAGENMLPEEICYRRAYVARGNMLPEEICCRRRYVAGGDMLLEGICYRRRYVAGRDMLLEGICYQSGYDAGGYTMLKVSSQRRDLAKGSIQPNEVSAKGGI